MTYYEICERGTESYDYERYNRTENTLSEALSLLNMIKFFLSTHLAASCYLSSIQNITF